MDSNHVEENKAIANDHGDAPQADDKAAIIARNKAALQKRKDDIAAKKAAEDAKALPAGWKRVESRSEPGSFVYENIHTEERQAWFPDVEAPEEVSAAPVSAADADRAALIQKNKDALAARKAAAQGQKATEAKLELPSGWIRTESRSRPGEVVYENTVTGERQAWFPDQPAEVDDAKSALAKKNKAALDKRKKALQQKKSEDNSKKLPAGWKRVESRSRPGEFVYENELTEERQAWFPDAPAEKPLPEGWKKVESRSYPGEFVYENKHTLERQAWVPTEPAPKTENQAAPASAPAVAKAPPAVVVATAIAQYDYTASDPDTEMDMMEGDEIDVEYKAPNGWWVGKNKRTMKSGIFPGTYVQCN